MPKVMWIMSYGFCSKFHTLSSSAKIWKSVNIWQRSYSLKVGTFLRHSVERACVRFTAQSSTTSVMYSSGNETTHKSTTPAGPVIVPTAQPVKRSRQWKAVIIGLVIVVFIAVAFVVLVILCCVYRRKYVSFLFSLSVLSLGWGWVSEWVGV